MRESNFKQMELRDIPENWNVKKIGDIGNVIGGGTPSTKEESYYNGAIPWITPKDLSNYSSVFIEKGERNITKEGLENSSARLMPAGTVLFSSRAPIGYVAIAKNEVSTNQGFKSIVCNENFANNIFVYYSLKYNAKKIESISSGSVFKEVSGTALKNFKIIVPTLEEQDRIANILYSLDQKIDLNRQMNNTLEQIAQALFKRWFIDFEFPNENGDPYRSRGGRMVDSKWGRFRRGGNLHL
ncbi:MAG: restriction endonuclease subunit S [Methanosarcina barkeri]|nr:restriction endonuclease subunit S [Methanosarcina sp. ERenArc_MAG2]